MSKFPLGSKILNSFDTKYLALSGYSRSYIPCTAKIALKYSMELALVTVFIILMNDVLLAVEFENIRCYVLE